jgi:hypothetical protein|tara:strand:- start:1030 stop:1164 length:135 start_codon:yes stop_codon:yes gene_type:complete
MNKEKNINLDVPEWVKVIEEMEFDNDYEDYEDLSNELEKTGKLE